MHFLTSLAINTLFFTALPAFAQGSSGLYTKKSPVLQVTAKTYDNLIAKSNQSAILEFYAPWCGHCQNLKPAYEKAAKSVENLSVKVAAINCDEDENKAFCGTMGVKGFPTLKTVKPGKKFGKPIVSDYNGERSAKAIVDTVIDAMPNHVVKVTDDTLAQFLADWKDLPKAILFADKATVSPLLKSLAIDFKDAIKIAQVHKKQQRCVETFGITEYPSFLLLPGPEPTGERFRGEMKSKDELVAFLSQAAPPNPDVSPAAAPADAKPPKKSKKKSEKPKDSKKDTPPKPVQPETGDETEAPQKPMSDPDGIDKSSEEDVPDAASPPASPAPIPTLAGPEDLTKKCLAAKAGTCILAFIPATDGPPAATAPILRALAEINDRFAHTKTKAPRFFAVPLEAADLRRFRDRVGGKDDDDVALIAVNRKRGWWRRFGGDATASTEKKPIEEWIDEVRFGGGRADEKFRLPDDGSFAGAFLGPAQRYESAARAAADGEGDGAQAPVSSPAADAVEEARPVEAEAPSSVEEGAGPEPARTSSGGGEPDHDEL